MSMQVKKTGKSIPSEYVNVVMLALYHKNVDKYIVKLPKLSIMVFGSDIQEIMETMMERIIRHINKRKFTEERKREIIEIAEKYWEPIFSDWSKIKEKLHPKDSCS